MDTNEQNNLAEVARLLRDRLIPKVLGPVWSAPTLSVQTEADLDGWWITIAHFGQPQVDMSVWLDSFARHEKKCFWVGFQSTRKGPINTLSKSMKQPLPTLTWDDTNWDKEEDEFSQLKTPLLETLFGTPVCENYPNSEYFFGVYYHNSENLNYIVSQSSGFMMHMLGLVPDVFFEEADHYSSVENRLIIAHHLRRERDHELARRCKERDGYRCQVCGTKLDEVYGAIGEGFAEAHHIVPLSKIDGPIDRDPSHLKTVCPNCHRMLHRLHGNEDDFDDLRSRMAQARGNTDPASAC